MRKLRLLLIMLTAIGTAALATADTVEMENGDKLEVTIVEETETTLIVEHPVFGRMEVPRSALKQPEPESPGLFGSIFLRGFKRELGFGVSGVNGNVNSLNINANLGLHRDTDTYRSHLVATYFYSTSSNPVNTNIYERGSIVNGNQFIGDYQHDLILMKSRLFIFGNVRYAYDAFQLWRNRLTVSGGPGYEIIKREGMSLRAELGVAGTGSWPEEYPDNRLLALGQLTTYYSSWWDRRQIAGWNPELVIAGVYTWQPLKGHDLSIDATYLPVLTDFSQFRILSNAAYTIALAGLEGLGVRFGVNYEYQSDPGFVTIDNFRRSLKKNNVKYFASIVYEF